MYLKFKSYTCFQPLETLRQAQGERLGPDASWVKQLGPDASWVKQLGPDEALTKKNQTVRPSPILDL